MDNPRFQVAITENVVVEHVMTLAHELQCVRIYVKALGLYVANLQIALDDLVHLESHGIASENSHAFIAMITDDHADKSLEVEVLTKLIEYYDAGVRVENTEELEECWLDLADPSRGQALRPLLDQFDEVATDTTDDWPELIG